MSSWRSSSLPPGSPIMPVPPPASEMGRCPACWKRRSVQSWSRLPTWRLSALGSKPAYTVRPGSSSRLGNSESVDLVDQAAEGEVLRERGHAFDFAIHR